MRDVWVWCVSCVLFYIFTVLLFHWQCCLLILYILLCCLHCDCLGLAAIKWFLTAFETLNLLTYLLTYLLCCWLNNMIKIMWPVKHPAPAISKHHCIFQCQTDLFVDNVGEWQGLTWTNSGYLGYHHHHICLINRFSGQPGLVGSPSFFFLHLFQKRFPGINGMRFHRSDDFAVT